MVFLEFLSIVGLFSWFFLILIICFDKKSYKFKNKFESFNLTSSNRTRTIEQFIKIYNNFK